MVIFGGLELVAAGYLLHEHSKHKEERARLEEEEAALERRRRRRRRHSADRRRTHSHDRRHSYSNEYEDIKPPRDSRPQYPTPTPRPAAATPYPAAATPYLAPTAQPARPNSAPPQQQPQQEPYYPPTGWPAHWEQSQRPEPNAGPRQAAPLPTKYGWQPDQEHVDTNAYPNPQYSPAPASRPNPQYSPAPASQRRRTSRGRSEARPADSAAQMSGARPVAYSPQPVASPHVHFAVPDNRSDPPPAYSR